MTLAAGSSDAAIRALLPAMVRGECGRYKRLQQHKQDEQQQDPAAVLAAVVDGVYALLEGTPAAACPEHLDTVTARLKGVLEVLGGAAASSLVQQVLGNCTTAEQGGVANAGNAAVVPAAAAGGTRALQLAKALSKGCSAVLTPQMQQRRKVANRLQQLVATTPLAAPQQQQPGAAAAAEESQQVVTDKQLFAQAKAAAGAGDWQHFVQLWEQLTEPALAKRLLTGVQQQLKQGSLVDTAGLCGALGVWAAAQEHMVVRVQRQWIQAVVEAVQAAAQQQVVAGGARRGRGGRA
jgi:hypothetical protein